MLLTDSENIYKFGEVEKSFRVSEEIKFYEKEELEEWIRKKKDILLIAMEKEEIVGFACCKVMSSHWGVVDNLYVKEEWRKKGVGSLIFNKIIFLLKKKKIKYVNVLVDVMDSKTRGYLEKRGFKSQKEYVWMDKFIG